MLQLMLPVRHEWLTHERGYGKLVIERLTNAEICHQVGATREMVGRILRDLARGDYIKADRGRMTILRTLPKRW